MKEESRILERYQRQVAYAPLGLEGQRRLAEGTALIVGVGGLGSWTAELLARAGVGRIRIVDDDRVELINLHRQALYDEPAAALGDYKVRAAAARIGQVNASVHVEPIVERVSPKNLPNLADGMGVILDGTDNFATRFILNDFAVREGRPWVFAGVMGAEAQTMTVLPGRTACLRCVLHDPPPPECCPTCVEVGVLGPAVAMIASMVALEAVKVLTGKLDSIRSSLRRVDLWEGHLRSVPVDPAQSLSQCPCCRLRQFDFLDTSDMIGER